MMSAVGQTNSSVATKVAQHLGKLASQIDRVNAKLETSPNAGQLKKAQRLLSNLADGQIIDHPRFTGDSLIRTAVAAGNSLNFGQAIKHPATPTAPPPPADPPAPPSEPPATTPELSVGTILDTTA